ncbi:MAG TPA: hypothetical protein VKT72_12645 [Candidatus Baltobacteraceae bacterium]|nr:hypothetical protein [Candidatus Baltobacteraceae bacterium]
MRLRPLLLLGALLSILAGCSGSNTGGPLPTIGGQHGVGVFDGSTFPCVVSYDGLVWYAVPAGAFAPIDVTREQCSATNLQANTAAPIPSWAKPSGPTQTIFVATSLQELGPLGGMQILESVAHPHHVPVTWLIGNLGYLVDQSAYDDEHVQNGDDVEAEPGNEPVLEHAFSWYKPLVSVQIGGRGRPQRDPASFMSIGEDAFWGITWNSRGTDGIEDYGAPWGSYCADVTSYKRPAPDASCALLAFEWTARDLTRAYLASQEASFSTDPDDLQQRGGFSVQAAQQYIAAIADAYAAAGQSQPIVMMSQQESQEMFNAGDPQIMDALYGRVAADGMKTETLAQASTDARAFSAQPRAVAFPFIAGGPNVSSPMLNGDTLYPGTIDYHDTVAGMTFIAGQTLPSRVFRYADYPVSENAVPLPQVPPSQLPALTNVAAGGGSIGFDFTAPIALHYGVALWSDPVLLGLSGSGVHPAGHAGVVLVFDLQPGHNQILFACSRCSSTTFSYAM